MSERPFRPLSDYGIVGDCRGALLVARDGSVDWACLPRFDDPPTFGRLLDRGRGGHWTIAPVGERTDSRIAYLDRTAVLETVHNASGGSVRVFDVVVPPELGAGSLYLRVCEGLSGEVELVHELDARDGFGGPPLTIETGECGLHLAGERLAATLTSTLAKIESQTSFTLREGESASFSLGWDGDAFRPSDAPALLEASLDWWRSWCGRIAYDGPYRSEVERSAITLKLLTYTPSGAIVAAPTTSLPERPGGESNWDYRYTWVRDAALALYGWFATGLRDEGNAFFDWICARVGEDRVPEKGLKVMYDVDGGSDHSERTLPDLEGYLGSQPVRVGNDACTQVQLDVYGEVLDCFATACAWGREDKLELWSRYLVLADWVVEHWQEPDDGIWEARGDPQHHVYSKVMAWVALDRALRVAGKWRLHGDLGQWALARTAIRESVLEHGWHDELGAFRQSFGSSEVDAVNLLLPLVGFIPAEDPRARSNLERIRAELEVDGLVFRNRDSSEGAFALCSFWLVNALAHAGQIEEAASVFERAHAKASPLGLFSEEIDVGTGALLGNIPQSFVHAGALTAAVNLARVGPLGDAPAAEDAPPGIAHLVPLQSPAA